MKKEEKQQPASLPPLCLLAAVFAMAPAIVASPFPDDEDGVNFLLGVSDYNPAFHQPHFPGYPVYIALGKALAFLTGSNEWGLVALSLVSTIGAGFALSRFVPADSRWPATALLFWANPAIFAFSHKIFTEPFALFLLSLTALSAGAGTGLGWFAAGFVSGALMGVRASWWPFAAVYIFMSWRKNLPIPCVGGFVIGVLAWVIPMVEIVGADELYAMGRDFVAGHFIDWGGAVTSAVSPADRVATIFATLATVVAGTGLIHEYAVLPWILFIGVGVLASAFYSRERTDAARMFLTASLFYLVWVALGQNVEKARHFIPLIPTVIIALGPFIRRAWPLAVIAGAALAVGVSIAHFQRTQPDPPTARLHDWLEDKAKRGTVVYCGPAERFFDKYFSKTPVKSVKHAKDLQREIKSTWPAPEHALVCDDIPGVKFRGKTLAEFPARGGDPVDRTLRIYEVEKAR